MEYVIGPWVGPILNATSGEVFVGLTTKEHSGMLI
jgi:hypothetical protein